MCVLCHSYALGTSYESSGDHFVDTPHVTVEHPVLRHRIKDCEADVQDFFLHLAVNHSAFLESIDGGNDVQMDPSKKLLYSASSADEGVLVYSALHFGFPFVAQSGNTLEVKRPNASRLKVITPIHIDASRSLVQLGLIFAERQPLYLHSVGL